VKLLERAATIDDALNRVAPGQKHSMVLGEAIRNAGTLNIPTDRDGFLRFVSGPLYQAAKSIYGPEVAQALVADVARSVAAEAEKAGTLPIHEALAVAPEAPTGAAPVQAATNRAKETLDYGADLQSVWCDIALLDPTGEREPALRSTLERRGYRLFAATDIKKVTEVCRRRYVHALIAALEPGGYSLAHTLRVELGPQTPPVVLLGGTVALHAPRPGVFKVLPMQLDSELIEVLESLPRKSQR
jgi:hypothetical protein